MPKSTSSHFQHHLRILLFLTNLILCCLITQMRYQQGFFSVCSKQNYNGLLLIMTESIQAEPEQGFFPEHLTITIAPNLQPSQEQRRPTLYEARVLASYPGTFKFPRQIYQRHQAIPTCKDENCVTSLNGNQKDPIQQESAYTLIYDKFRSWSGKKQSQADTSREVNLDHLLHYRESDYSKLDEKPFEQLMQPNRQDLQFISNFQSGNLHKAYKDNQKKNHYICFIENDTNSNGYNQLFYFALRGIKKGLIYRFSIVNFTKKQSFFKVGMKPVLFSLKRHQTSGNGWYRKGYNISYAKTALSLLSKQLQTFYTLQFQVDFEYEDDFITISSAIPYSYSRLIERLKQLKRLSSERKITFQLETVAYSLSNNQVPEVIITKSSQRQNRESEGYTGGAQGKKAGNSIKFKKTKGRTEKLVQNKKTFVILARQHPAETNSSVLMEEILYMLFQQHNEKVRWLLQHFQFRIYPMVNVDGVIYGNSRCDLAGFDLNRTWRHPIKELHPQIYAIKKRLKALANKIAYCIDLHSHSKMYNVFNYGCSSDSILSRLFSWMVSKNTPHFHFPSCNYGLSFDKRHTLRAVLAQICSPEVVITIEASYYGVKNGNQVSSFQPKLFIQIAKAILFALRSYLRKDMNSKKCLKQLKENQQNFVSEGHQDLTAQRSDSQVEKDVDSFQSKLRRVISNQQFIEKIKRKYDDEEMQMQEEQQRSQEIKQKKIEHINTPKMLQNHRSQEYITIKQEQISINQTNRERELIYQDRPKLLQRIKENKEANIAKYNVDSQCNNLPLINHHRNAWNRSKRLRKPSRLYIRHQNDQERSVNNGPPQVFDDQEFQKEMKFLYRELRNGLREDYLKNERYKEKQKWEKSNLAKGKRFQSLNNLAQAARNSLNKSKANNIKSLLPNSFKIQDKLLLRIKSEHYENLSEKEDTDVWRYNLNSSEMIDRSSEKQFDDSKLQNRDRSKPFSYLPIFNKFFKMKHWNSFKQ